MTEASLSYDTPDPEPYALPATPLHDCAHLVAALAKARVEFAAVAKTKTATVQTKSGAPYTYTYADLANVVESITPALSRHGLAIVQRLAFLTPNTWGLVTELRHDSGQVLSSVYPLPDPGSVRPQELGSQITYARRYSVCAIVGIAAEEDDDAQAAEGAAARGGARPATSKGGLALGRRDAQAATAPPPATNANGDVDDQAGRGAAPPAASAPPRRPPPAPARPPGGDSTRISEGQGKMLWARAHARREALGFEEKDAASTILHYVLGRRGVEHIADLPRSKFDQVLKDVEAYDPELTGDG